MMGSKPSIIFARPIKLVSYNKSSSLLLLTRMQLITLILLRFVTRGTQQVCHEGSVPAFSTIQPFHILIPFET